MRSELLKQLSTAQYIEDQGLQYAFLLSLFRFVTQVAAYSVFEFTSTHAECPDQMQEHAQRLLQPSDGDFVSTLDLCLPATRSVWPDCCAAWFDARGTEYPQSGREICLLIISKRNDRLGHGVFDQNSLLEEAQTLPLRIGWLIDILAELMPVFEGVDAKEVARLNTPAGSINIETIKHRGENLVLLRKLEKRGSVWRMRGQTLTHLNSLAVIIEISDGSRVLTELSGRNSGLVARNVELDSGIWRASVLLPMRQTQTFEGRSEEIGMLKDWWADADSRACLVYGDGGIGKTTLVLQFLNDLLDDPPTKLEWKPELIFYYSAKLTRWGISGLEQIGGISANVNEAIRSLVRVLESNLSRDWHSEESKSLISKAATLFQAAGLKRDSILLVIDNTETLARTAAEEAGLAKILRELSTKLAKLLITSRRSEKFESTHIPVPPMPEDVGAILIAKLADAYSSQSILDAGDSRRRKLTRQFGGKPILLDVLARHIANTSCSIDDGVTAILNQERGDLGAFLFEDAWKRMEASYRDVFLALGQLGGSVGEQMLNWACAEFTCYAPNWLSAYEETRFGSLIDYGPYYDITLDSGAREFISSKFERLTGPEKQRITTAVGHIRKKHHQATSAAEERVSDRVAAAFRTTAAKAAKLAGMRRDFDAAVRWYEEATLVDSANAALFDRYAWYLMVNDQLDRAAVIARKATALDPNDADSHFTAGMIAARKGEISAADAALETSRVLGKSNQLVDLQRARARLHHGVNVQQTDPEDCLEKSLDAIKLLDVAAMNPAPANYKHEAERIKLIKRVERLIDSVRTVRTFTTIRN